MIAAASPAGPRDSRRAVFIGRHARLELVFGRRRGRTVLTHAYAEPPFRVGRTLEADGAAYVIIACSGPGIFPGDRLRQSVRVEQGARVLLASQSALQAHPSDGLEDAVLESDYEVEDGGRLYCHWDPIIPFADARLFQRLNLTIRGGARLYWGDGLMSGRAGRGEEWRFGALDHELRLRVDDALMYFERYRIEPRKRAVRHPWITGDACYTATAIVRTEAATEEFAERLQAEVAAIEAVRGGVDLLAPGLVLARILARHGPAFSAARTIIRSAALASEFADPGRLYRR